METPENRHLRLVSLLKKNAYSVYLETLGHPSPMLRAVFEEIRHPQPGDLVLEITTHQMDDRDVLAGIGRLVREVYEPFCPPEEAEAHGFGPEEPIPTERVFYIRLEFDDNRLFRWVNASFIKILERNLGFDLTRSTETGLFAPHKP